MMKVPAASENRNPAAEMGLGIPLPMLTWPAVERRAVRRRGNIDQGRALEMLGHSVEYLIDSRMFGPADPVRGNQEAIQILMRLSRAVFAECPEVVPLSRRLTDWLTGVVSGRSEPGSGR